MSGTVDFQTQVYAQYAPAVEGDFASANPHASALGLPGGLVSGTPLTVGRFAWIDAADGRTARSMGTGLPDGFVHRASNPTLITLWLGKATMLVVPGRETTIFSRGEFWVKNAGTTVVARGQKAFANFADGSVYFAAAGTAAAQAASVTASVAAATSSFTGSIGSQPTYPGAFPAAVMTVTAVSSGQIYPGQTLSGTNVASGTKVVEQLTSTETDGAFGKKGTYLVTPVNQTVASTTISGTHGLMTVTATGSGTVGIGDSLAAGGGGNTATVGGTLVTALGLGADVTKFILDNNTVVTSGTITMAGAIELDHWWAARSGAAAGELVPMTSWRNG